MPSQLCKAERKRIRMLLRKWKRPCWSVAADTSASVSDRAKSGLRARPRCSAAGSGSCALAELLISASIMMPWRSCVLLPLNAVLAREGARIVIRELWRCKQLGPACGFGIASVALIEGDQGKGALPSRMLFHPIRLALTGRVGEGELDRVILLLDEGPAEGLASIKGVRQRMLEFLPGVRIGKPWTD